MGRAGRGLAGAGAGLTLEYLDALLAGGTARYPDVTRRLSDAVTRRLDGAGRDQWLAARTSLDAALAETVALAANDVLLEDLLARLAQVPGATGLLLGVSVYREPADTSAVLFVAGLPDPAARHTPDRAAASEQITAILAAAGITVEESFDLAGVPGHIQEQLAPHLAELNRPPAPPFRPSPGLGEQAAACQAASLLTVTGEEGQQRVFVHRWTATALAARAAREPGQPLAGAHRQAAAYWLWRVRAWPQDRAADVHDLLEARHHLLQAGDTEDAGQVTEQAVSQLHTWGAWDQEASLIHDTLARLPVGSPRQGAWIHQLGVLAQDRGDYDQAARHYQRALDINERIGDQAGAATIYSQLGILEKDRGGPAAAAITWHVKALAIRLRLGSPRLKTTCAVSPITAPEPAPGPSPASWLRRPAAPTWLRQSQPCSTSWTTPTTPRPDRAGHSLTESARSNESRRAAVVVTVVSATRNDRQPGPKKNGVRGGLPSPALPGSGPLGGAVQPLSCPGLSAFPPGSGSPRHSVRSSSLDHLADNFTLHGADDVRLGSKARPACTGQTSCFPRRPRPRGAGGLHACEADRHTQARGFRLRG